MPTKLPKGVGTATPESAEGTTPHSIPLGPISSERFVGRAEILDPLTEALDRPGLVEIRGEAGVGKTRLIQELLSRTAPKRVIAGHCAQLREPFPLEPVIDALRRADPIPLSNRELSPNAGSVRSLIPELADLLPPAPDPLDSASAERHRVFRGLAELIDVLTPCIVILEDLHWADETTYEFLAFLIPKLPSGLNLIVTYRSEDLPASCTLPSVIARASRSISLIRAELKPLDVDEISELVANLFDQESISRTFAEHLFEKTAGLPFAVEEFVGLLRQRGDIVRRDGMWTRRVLEEIAVPPAIREGILERAVGLSPDARRALNAAAVLGPAGYSMLRVVSQLSDQQMREALVELTALSLLLQNSDGDYDFRHALARQTIYESIVGPEREELHINSAEAWESTERIDLYPAIARHYRKGRSIHDFLESGEKAVDVLVSVWDETAAFSLLEEMLAIPDLRGDDRARLTLKMVKVGAYHLVHGELIHWLELALSSDGVSSFNEGELRVALSNALSETGRSEESHSHLLASLPLLGEHSPSRLTALIRLSIPYSTLGTESQHLEYLAAAENLVKELDDPLVRTQFLASQAGILIGLGVPHGWDAFEQLPLNPSGVEERRHVARGLSNVARTAFHIGHHDRSRAALAEAMEHCNAIDIPLTLGNCEVTALLLALATGSWDDLMARSEAAACARDGMTRCGEIYFIQAYLSVAQGQPDAETRMRAALERTLASGSLPLAFACSGELARLLMARGEIAEASEVIDRATAILRQKEVWVWGAEILPEACAVLAGTDRVSEMQRLAKDFRSGIETRDSVLAFAAGHRVQAAVDMVEGRDASPAFRRSLDLYERMSRTSDIARTHETRGRWLLGKGIPEGGSDLKKALSEYEALGAAWEAARIRGVLRDFGIKPPRSSRSGRRQYGSELSPREVEVAELAALGQSDKEIARTLFLSPWTVSHHIASIKRKLGVPNRLAIAGPLEARSKNSDS